MAEFNDVHGEEYENLADTGKQYSRSGADSLASPF